MTDSPASAAAYEAITTAARRTACAMIKRRARDYARSPRDLDALIPTLSKFSPKGMLIAFRSLPPNPPARWTGFGGEVVFINRQGAILYARLLRAKAAQLAKRARGA